MAIDEAAYLAGYRNHYLDAQNSHEHDPHFDSVELEGVTVRKGDCVTVDHHLHGKPRDLGEFVRAWRERKHLVCLVWTEGGGFRVRPAKHVHPCTTASSGEAR